MGNRRYRFVVALIEHLLQSTGTLGNSKRPFTHVALATLPVSPRVAALTMAYYTPGPGVMLLVEGSSIFDVLDLKK